MIDDMGIFRTTLSVAALATPDERRDLYDLMVDTGSEYNWLPTAVLLELGVSPVRIDRDSASRESPGIPGLYPVGEGAGYAGGIVSAAVDGLKTARAIVAKYARVG